MLTTATAPDKDHPPHYNAAMPQPRKRKLPPIDLGNEPIHARIGRIRRKRGYSQADLAQALGLSQPNLSQIESGARALSAEMAARVAGALGISTDELIGTKRTKQQEPTYSLAVMRRIQRIESLPKDRRKLLYQSIDDFIRREDG